MIRKRIFFSTILGLFAIYIAKAESHVCDTSSKASDFVYTLPSGEQASLYALSSNHILLYFYDPTCEDCEALMKRLSASELLKRLIDKRELQVLAIYPDNDSTEWKKHAAHIPATWINGYDKQLTIIPEGNYMFRALPALYLLDRDKNILLREATTEAIEKELKN